MATVEPLESLLLNKYVRVAALTRDLRAAFFYVAREFFYYSSVITLLLLPILMKGSYPIFKLLTSNLELVISFMATVDRKFIQGRHAGQYFGSERPRALPTFHGGHNLKNKCQPKI